jgi:phosphoribosyl 1,2-cyclic phosphodiesterase
MRFWGVRGSLPAPLTPAQIRSKISAVIERLGPAPLPDAETRERFLAGLPPWLFGTTGGNTPCIEVRLAGAASPVIFDAGSGLRELGAALQLERPKPLDYHLFFSHFHWDHIQGFPFFSPAYDPEVTINFYLPEENPSGPLDAQMRAPFFPVSLDTMRAQKNFIRLETEIPLGEARLRWRKMNHPGGSYAYRLDEGGRSLIYATDSELKPGDFAETDANAAFFFNAGAIVIDAQYTPGEAVNKLNWGHSSYSLAVDFAARWGIKRIILFHHDPAYDDRKLYHLLEAAREYAQGKDECLKVDMACEGMELDV